MAFPTTDMKGHSKLRERVTIALDRCQEQQWLDFKESQPWPQLKWRLIKTIMAMANLRDGGIVVAGVCERDDAWDLTGVAPEHLSSYDFDEIADQVSKYASPEVRMEVVLHQHYDGNTYLVFNVHQFTDTPVVCKCNNSDTLPKGERMYAGDFFVRPSSGRPQTARVSNAGQLQDLLELAAESRARRLLELAHRVGLVPSESADTHFDQESASITNPPVPVLERPYWRVVIRPDHYDDQLIPSRSDCMKYVEKAKVRLRGWDFPHLSRRETELGQGSNWIASWCEFMGSIEYWRFFQSGQFVHLSAVREVTEDNWRGKLQEWVTSRLRHVKDVDWDRVPGFISITNLLYNITEYFEFASRLAQAGAYQGNVSIRIEVHGIKGFVLAAEPNRAWWLYCAAHEEHLAHTWTVASDRLIAETAELSLLATAWFLESFGWMDPALDVLRREQQDFLRKAT